MHYKVNDLVMTLLMVIKMWFAHVSYRFKSGGK